LLKEFREVAAAGDEAGPALSGQANLDQKPNVILFTVSIGTCAKMGEVGWAFQLLKEMRAEGVKPNVFTYNSMLKVCAEDAQRSKSLNLTLAVYSKMTGTASPFRPPRPEGLVPDSYTYGALLMAASRVQDGAFALRLV
jgi:pentatricopeptide repeat protein